MERDEDFLDEIIRERTAVNPGFPALVEAALERRRARRERELRRAAGLPTPDEGARGGNELRDR